MCDSFYSLTLDEKLVLMQEKNVGNKNGSAPCVDFFCSETIYMTSRVPQYRRQRGLFKCRGCGRCVILQNKHIDRKL